MNSEQHKVIDWKFVHYIYIEGQFLIFSATFIYIFTKFNFKWCFCRMNLDLYEFRFVEIQNSLCIFIFFISSKRREFLSEFLHFDQRFGRNIFTPGCLMFEAYEYV